MKPDFEGSLRVIARNKMTKQSGVEWEDCHANRSQ